jgi:glycosyltransferase involved in cell wall biosynthesis
MKSLGIDDKFVAVYTGAHGVANGLFQVLDAAELLRHRDDIAFLFVGDGRERQNLLNQIASRALKNCHMPGQVPKTRIPGILLACHVGLQILTQVSRPRWVTPNKLFDYMFAGMPTIVNFAGTTGELVEREQVGLASSPGSAADLAAKVAYYAVNPAIREQIGRRAREFAWARYDRASIASQLLDEFRGVIAERRIRKGK